MVKKVEYSYVIGLWKSIKNVLITVGVPAVAVLLNTYTEWMPESWYPIFVPLMSILSYMVKNKVTFKG